MKVPGVPFVQGDSPGPKIRPTAIVMHRTFGKWAGDYAIGQHGRPPSERFIGFHFLIGKQQDRWAQFYDTTTLANHAKGANEWAIGIEFEGTNTDALTEWQVNAAAWVIAIVCKAHGIPMQYFNDGPRRKVNGLLSHSLVPGSTHTDLVTDLDWLRIVAHLPKG